MSFLTRCVFLATALYVSACSIVLGYAEPEEEESPEACGDGVDNDLDGATDCFDDSCICEENSADFLCIDGLDNDRDGLVDLFDPACWDLGAPQLQRCATVEGTSIESLASTAGSWSGAQLDAGLLLLPQDGTVVGLDRVLTGARRPFRLEFTLLVVVETTISLRLTGQGGAPDLEVRLEPASELLSFAVGRTAAAVADLQSADALGTWRFVVERGMSGGPRLQVRSPDGAVVDAMPDTRTVAFGEAPAYRLSIRATPVDGSSAASLTSLSLMRVPLHPCGTPVPPRDSPPGAVVEALAASDRTYCALVAEGASREIFVYSGPRSERSGDRVPVPPVFERVGSFEPGPARGPRHPLIAWAGDRFVGVVESFSPAGEVELELIESPDCEDEQWRSSGAPFAVEESVRGRLIGYAVEDLTGFHRLFVAAPADPASARPVPGILRWRSEDGAPGSFIQEPVPVDRSVLRTLQRPRDVAVTAGGHLVRLFVNDANDSLDVANQGGGGGAGAALVEPTPTPGTFDAHEIVQGVLWLEPFGDFLDDRRRWSGLVAYSARSCDRCPPRFGYALFYPVRAQTMPRDPLLLFEESAFADPASRPY